LNIGGAKAENKGLILTRVHFSGRVKEAKIPWRLNQLLPA
jgi:hypothetical protein